MLDPFNWYQSKVFSLRFTAWEETMSESDKMQAIAIEMAKKIAEELMSAQAKLFQDEMKKM